MAPLRHLLAARRPLTRSAVGLALSFAATLLAACGHPASPAECQEILDKVVELELAQQNVRDPATLEKRKGEVREARGKELLPQCQGRKVTEAAMRCVRAAQSFETLNNTCLR